MAESGDAVARAFIARWNDHDADGLAALFVADADFVNVVGYWWRSPREIRKAHDYGFRRIFGSARLEIQELSARVLTDDIHVVHILARLEGQVGPDGVALGARMAVMSMVAQRGEAGFRIVSFHNTDRIEGVDTFMATADGPSAASYLSKA